MAEFRDSIDIAASPETAFGYLAATSPTERADQPHPK